MDFIIPSSYYLYGIIFMYYACIIKIISILFQTIMSKMTFSLSNHSEWIDVCNIIILFDFILYLIYLILWYNQYI